ncbi:ribonuclease H-like domain-containing protein [Tanacetum coccineum]|uniref:Ribonuclease H-like domain-containing protein n=1 Tax=Tanacetum coccineum TaxID=301880 RepID=A0ABQ5CRD2_9ASTR
MKATMAWRCRACDDLIIMANIIPPGHVDDLPDPALAIPEPALVDENEEPEEEEEFEDEEEFEEEESQEEEYDMEVDIEEEENEPGLIFPYVKADPLNPLPPASDSEHEDVIEVEDMVDPKDETVPASVYEVSESSTVSFHREDSDGLLPGFMRRDINSLFDGSLSRYKACLVANRRNQQLGIDCHKTFSPVDEPATIRTVLSLAIFGNWPIHQLYVKNDFLHGHLSETVYMHHPLALWTLIEPFELAHMQNCNPFRTPIDTDSKLGFDSDHVSDSTLFVFISNAYTNVDWASCPVTRCSTSGYCVFLGDNLLSLSAKR